MKDYLIQDGIKDIEWIELDNFQSCIESVKKGLADIGFVNSGFGYNAIEQGLKVAFDVGDYFPRNVCCRQTTNRGVFETKREALVRFQMANLRAYAFAYGDAKNKQETIGILADYSGLDEEFVDYCVYSGIMKYELDPATDKIREFYDIMIRSEQINPPEDLDFDQHMDLSIYQEALERLIDREPNETVYRQLFDQIVRDNSEYMKDAN